MKNINILMLTNIYPTDKPGYAGTPVCHYFVKEWHQMGYNVMVVHFESLFPQPYYWFARLLHSFIRAKTGAVVNLDVSKNNREYFIENIPVLFVPMKKYRPHQRFNENIMNRAFDDVCKCLRRRNFIPDIVVGHFTLPQLEFLYMFKKAFQNIRTVMVIHSDGSEIKSLYGSDYKKFIDSVDVWGYRSEAFRKRFENLYGRRMRSFLCYSGIPETYINPVTRDFSKGLNSFVFLGSLYKLKRVDDSIIALNKSFGKEDFTFNVIGKGAEEDNLKKIVSKLSLQNKVVFHGYKNRNEAQVFLSLSDCFVMVSEREAFGLVYLEAMAKGCITIATRGQGIDGIIVDGINGFLCDSCKPDELASLITKIRKMSPEVLMQISRNAINTAKELTNRKVAENYIKSILN